MNKYLKRLQELGYIVKVEPLEPGGKGRSRAYWKISDPTSGSGSARSLPNRSRLARGRIGEVAREIEKRLPSYTGHVFEDVCRDWIGRVSPLGSNADEVGSWWNRKSNVEVDIVALNKKGYTVLGECKWWKGPLGVDALDALVNAKAVIGPKASQAKLVLFSKSGFSTELRARAASDGAELFTVDDLFT